MQNGTSRSPLKISCHVEAASESIRFIDATFLGGTDVLLLLLTLVEKEIRHNELELAIELNDGHKPSAQRKYCASEATDLCYEVQNSINFSLMVVL